MTSLRNRLSLVRGPARFPRLQARAVAFHVVLVEVEDTRRAAAAAAVFKRRPHWRYGTWRLLLQLRMADRAGGRLFHIDQSNLPGLERQAARRLRLVAQRLQLEIHAFAILLASAGYRHALSRRQAQLRADFFPLARGVCFIWNYRWRWWRWRRGQSGKGRWRGWRRWRGKFNAAAAVTFRAIAALRRLACS